MNIVIAGGGKVGEVLCRELSVEGNNVVLIERQESKLDRLINKNDITGYVGNGADVDTQEDAGVSTCDVFIAVTEKDEINIIAALIARKLGADYTIARVRNPEYTEHNDFMRKSLGINMIINPEQEAAQNIARVMRYPEAMSVEEFANGQVNIVEIEVTPGHDIVGLTMSEFQEKYGQFLICAISRGEEVIIPSGATRIKKRDHLHVIGGKNDLTRFYHKAGFNKEKIRSVMIVGGGKIGHYLIKMTKGTGVELKVIERDLETAEELSSTFPKTVIVQGDGTDQEFLKEERIELFDTVVSLTGVDEENILISLFALTQGPSKIITKVSRTDLLKILKDNELQTIITPKQLIAAKIIRFVRSLGETGISNVEALYRIVDNQVEALQFRLAEHSSLINKPLKQLSLKTNVLVAYIVRKNQLIFPTGEDSMQVGDKVIVVSTNKTLKDIDDILQ